MDLHLLGVVVSLSVQVGWGANDLISMWEGLVLIALQPGAGSLGGGQRRPFNKHSYLVDLDRIFLREMHAYLTSYLVRSLSVRADVRLSGPRRGYVALRAN